MNTLESIQNILIKEYSLTRGQLAPDAQLAALGVDSLGLIELMFLVEERLGVAFPDDKAPALTTVGDLVTYIDHLMNTQASGRQPGGPVVTPAI
jgi:acyl carrier protein